MSEEIWKSIEGYEGRYEVSSLGRARSLDRETFYKDGRKGRVKGRILKGAYSKAHGYVVIGLDSKDKRVLHRIIAEAFLPPTEYKETVNHINGDKLDNRASNLEWASYKRNNDHARDTSLNSQHGINCNLSKFSEHTIKAVKNVAARFGLNSTEIAELFDMSETHARFILQGKTRKRG
ncbi:NUMOD4 motif-containing HNH endonuclease [Halomonas sp. hl-4]|uniref:NUMOD4 motif-containing HNH endonuclease n=1 Tax=Halomonas sp. hl-4 TaxID=1761789 RepID=UPI000BC05F12|nr:NUMOD4 motif-containing HNH endonuclease [Halomonas sp. hl-4]SNY95553.1 NUMOD4 motif-containing protein [Halomonas sp. hl-4]